MIQCAQMFGYLPNMLELSTNICTQRCDYCYAKTWKHEQEPLDKVINNMLHQMNARDGLLPFLLRKKMPITISNRTDVMCAPDWKARLKAVKKLGFPVFMETKLTKDYKELVDILDPNTDQIYQTITGLNNKHEEHNHLSAQEKLDAMKWLGEQGFRMTLAVNPWLPDKCTVPEVFQMIEYAKPWGVVMRDYHRTSKSIDKHLFMKEFPKDETSKAREEVRAYCKEHGIYHDIDGFENAPYRELNLRLAENEDMYGGMMFVFQDFLIAIQELLDENPDWEYVDITFADFKEFYSEQIEWWKDCIFKDSDYTLSMYSASRWEHKRFGIEEFLKGFWNKTVKFMTYFDQYSDKFDEEGNRVYFRDRKGFTRFIEDEE